MRIISVEVSPNPTTVDSMITVVTTVLDNQGFITADKLLLKTKDDLTFIVKDS